MVPIKAQVVIYQQNFDGNNGTFSNALLSQVTPNNGWIANTTATQYLNYRHLWNVSTLGTGVSAPITSRSLGIGFFNANTPFTANNPFRTWSGTNCSVIPVTYRWAYVPISTVGYQNIEVEFKWRCSGESDASLIYDYGTVITSINGGANWLMDESGGTGGTTSYDGAYAGGLYFGNSGVQTQTISLPASRDNQANFALGFRMVVDECYGTGGGFIIDDIIVRGTPIGGCAGGTASPAYQFVETGNPATVSIAGYAGTNIQWQISPDGISSWTNVSGGSGANTDTYTTAALSNGTYYYRAEVTSSGCTDYSSVAEVYVAAEPNYCSGAGVGGSYLNNHIEDMLFHEWSDPFPGYLGGNYYDYSDTNTYGYATVVANQYHHFAATIRANGTGTASTTVAAWIDFNNDGVFNNTPFSSGGELLDIVNFSSTVGNTYAAYFTVPSAISGLRRMRVRALRGSFASIDPCGNYTNSQTKDLTIKVLPTIGSQVCGTVNGSADVVNANSTADKVYISRVLLEGPDGTVIDNNGQFFGVQAGSTVTMYNYSNMMGAFSNGLNLEAGQDYTITIEHSGYTCAAGVFIDYNGDGDFADTDELVGRISDPNMNPFIFNFTVPSTVTDGQEVALRVRLRYDDLGTLGSVINSCNNISDGLQQYSEVEDYRALLLSPTLVCDVVSNLGASVGAPANGLNHHLDVDWDGLSGATNYDVEISTDGSTFGSLQNVSTSSFDFNAGDNPNMPYWFRVRARDASQTCAWTTMSTPVYTACDVPAAPNVSNAAATTLDVALAAESPVVNPSYSEYSILCPGNGLYVQGDGTLGATEVFQTAASWGTITVTGLSTETEYCFVATARNVDGHVVGGINQVSATETFTTNVLNTTAGSGPTNVWWSPSSCTTGGMVYFASGGCPGGNVGFDGSFNSFYGCFLRSPAQNCTGLSSVIMTFDLSNSYFASQPGDRVYFNMWAPTAAQPGGTYIAASKVNGVSTDELFFSVLRNCENVEVEFDLSTVTDKSAILFYLNASCAYNNSNLFSVRYDNITLLEGSPGTCLSTTAAPFPI
ncbi:MAG: GEVED domain-containing protein [Bacteroidia bacterium]